MALNGRNIARTGKIAPSLYGALFCLVLPTLMALWARAVAPIVQLPVYGSPFAGGAIAACGLLLTAAGMWVLWSRGGGLPMNAYPPPRLVVSGVYALCPHPIYVGFVLACLGVSMAVRSAGGLWLVTPLAALGCVALVYGYERPDLERRFGCEALKGLRLAPPNTSERIWFFDCVRFYLFVLLPWLFIYEIVAVLGVMPHSVDTRLWFEARLPVWTWTEPIYESAYLVALAVPFLAGTRGTMRTLMIRCWLAMALVFPLYLFLPTHAPFRPFGGDGPLATLLRLERELDMPAEALPSFHVIWAILAALVAAGRGRKWRAAGVVWAVLVSASCVMNGMHAIADVVAGWAMGWLLLRADRLWEWLRRATESIANSWREWRAGGFRFINHGLYAGLGSFVCVGMVGAVAGGDLLGGVAATALGGLLGAAFWAQWVEGSPRLLRPFGFYGGLLGVILVACWLPDSWLFLAAYSVAGPWLQAIGRLRCLVQGCCHGRPADSSIGIRYLHPRSRVWRIAGMGGVPLHATPLYSILANAAAALILARMWIAGAPLHFIAGLYLILNGLGRFVEEAYRGEPQTPILAGLRLYQWIAIASVVAGAAITAMGRSGPAPVPHLTPAAVAMGAVFGVVSALALGGDFPESTHRFGRLT